MLSDEVAKLLNATQQPHRLHKDIAMQFHVPALLVSQLVKEAEREPGMLEKLRQREVDDEQQKLAIEESATQMLAANQPIVRAAQVQSAVRRHANLEVSSKLVRQVMRKDMHLGYRLAKTVPIQSNTERCLVLRQQFALRMLPLLEAGCFASVQSIADRTVPFSASAPTRRVINVDESWLNGTRFLRRI